MLRLRWTKIIDMLAPTSLTGLGFLSIPIFLITGFRWTIVFYYNFLIADIRESYDFRAVSNSVLDNQKITSALRFEKAESYWLVIAGLGLVFKTFN